MLIALIVLVVVGLLVMSLYNKLVSLTLSKDMQLMKAVLLKK